MTVNWNGYGMLFAAILLAGAAVSAPAQAQQPGGGNVPRSVTLFQNVRIFDGKSDRLSEPSHVLVRGNKIERISAQPIPTDRRADTVIVAGGGRTLMPGLIDMHWHTMLVRPNSRAVADVGRRLHQPGRRRRGQRHVAARIHDRSRPGRAVVRPQAGNRRRSHRRSANLSVRRRHHRHQRSRRLSPAVRSAAHPRPADADGTARRQHGGRQSG